MSNIHTLTVPPGSSPVVQKKFGNFLQAARQLQVKHDKVVAKRQGGVTTLVRTSGVGLGAYLTCLAQGRLSKHPTIAKGLPFVVAVVMAVGAWWMDGVVGAGLGGLAAGAIASVSGGLGMKHGLAWLTSSEKKAGGSSAQGALPDGRAGRSYSKEQLRTQFEDLRAVA
jgi:hypothetical protein